MADQKQDEKPPAQHAIGVGFEVNFQDLIREGLAAQGMVPAAPLPPAQHAVGVGVSVSSDVGGNKK